MAELMVDYITSLDGYGAAEGWPGLWGMGGPDYLAWLEEDMKNEFTLLMGANTYRLFAEFAARTVTAHVPMPAGRPLIVPSGASVRPGGRLPPATVQVSSPPPPTRLAW